MTETQNAYFGRLNRIRSGVADLPDLRRDKYGRDVVFSLPVNASGVGEISAKDVTKERSRTVRVECHLECQRARKGRKMM